MGTTRAITYSDGRVSSVLTPRIAKRFEELNGIPVQVLGVQDMPSGVWDGEWIKLWIWDLLPPDTDRAIWIDPDLLPLHRVVDLLPDDAPFCAVLECEELADKAASDNQVTNELRSHYNLDFFASSIECRDAFDKAKASMPNGILEAKFLQTQVALSAALMDEGIKTVDLPRELNWIPQFGVEAEGIIQQLRIVGFADEKRIPFMLSLLDHFDNGGSLECQPTVINSVVSNGEPEKKAGVALMNLDGIRPRSVVIQPERSREDQDRALADIAERGEWGLL